MGCNDQYLPQFSKVVINNQNYILGNNLENQARTVMLRISEKIKEDNQRNDRIAYSEFIVLMYKIFGGLYKKVNFKSDFGSENSSNFIVYSAIE